MLQPVRHHLELQLAHRAQQQHAAGHRAKDLDRAFFAQLREAGAQLLAAQRVGHLDAAEHLGREERQTGELQRLAFGDGVAQLQHAVVGNADDVAGKGLVEQLAALAEKADHRVRPQFLAAAHHLQPHAALEVAAGHAQEGDAVAVRRVHVGLDLEHHAGELGLLRLHHALDGRPRARRRRQVDQRVEHLTHAEVVDRRAEEHRRLAAGQERGFVERRSRFLHQLDLAAGLFVGAAEALLQQRVGQAVDDLVVIACCGLHPARTRASAACAGRARRRRTCPCPPAR